MAWSWTQAVCDDCWQHKQPGREPTRLRFPEKETCAYCGVLTESGIYMREDPLHVMFPRKKED